MQIKILLLDQPVKNRGDEAAHKSLLKKLTASFSTNCQITCLFRGVDEDTIKQMHVEAHNVKYLILRNWIGYRKIREWLVKSNAMCLSALFPFNREFDGMVKGHDVIMITPGGMNLGGFKTWNHLFLLLSCIKQKKRIIYYSRSIGPFYWEKWTDRLFSKKSIEVLRTVDFLSLRDKRSCQIADGNKIKHSSSIDTAFLDVPHTTLPKELEASLPDKYVVFVPNELVWHPVFKELSREIIIGVYLSIIDIICANKNVGVVMLPQLFNARNNDYRFFEELKSASKHSSRICVIPDTYSSDIQQAVIAKSQFVVGGRYHSIVFAINNHIPFVSLSYEHKMNGLLETLELTHRSVPFSSPADIENFNGNDFSKLLKIDGNDEIIKAQEKANAIAIQTFNEAIRKIQ